MGHTMAPLGTTYGPARTGDVTSLTCTHVCVHLCVRAYMRACVRACTVQWLQAS